MAFRALKFWITSNINELVWTALIFGCVIITGYMLGLVR